MKVARENTTFVQALQPVILNLQAEISAGREQWALSESQYGKLIAEWDALTPEDKEKLRNNLASIQLGELYNEIHRNWAGVCLKQKRTTEARRVLGKIGEVPAEEPGEACFAPTPQIADPFLQLGRSFFGKAKFSIGRCRRGSEFPEAPVGSLTKAGYLRSAT